MPGNVHRPAFNSAVTPGPSHTKRYLAHASFLAQEHSLMQIMSDAPSMSTDSRLRPDRQDFTLDLLSHRFMLASNGNMDGKGRGSDRDGTELELAGNPDAILLKKIDLGRFELAQQKPEKDAFEAFEKEFEDLRIDTGKAGIYDPLIGYNRFMFRVNDKLYFWILKPLARGYGALIPQEGRISISRFFKNLSFPIRFANNLLQGKFKRVGIETARFAVNTTIGLLGFFDLADEWYDLKPYDEDFGQTLGHYGAGDGFPLVLPLLGPSNIRDTLGIIPDIFFYPIDLLYQGDKYIFNPLFLGIFILETVNRTSLQIGVYENFKKNALDPYTLMRDAYKQNRDARIKE